MIPSPTSNPSAPRTGFLRLLLSPAPEDRLTFGVPGTRILINLRLGCTTAHRFPSDTRPLHQSDPVFAKLDTLPDHEVLDVSS